MMGELEGEEAGSFWAWPNRSFNGPEFAWACVKKLG